MRAELLRIGGDVYLNGEKIIFAVDFTNPPTPQPVFNQVDWLIGWAKRGMIAEGHDVSHFESRTIAQHEGK
jgi:hypothetical protein